MAANKKWPKMFYHPVHGGYVICENPNEVPEGFVDHPDKVEEMVTTFEGPLPCNDLIVDLQAKRRRPVDEDADEDADEDEDEDEDEEQKPAPKKPPAKKASAKKAPAKKAPAKKAPAKKAAPKAKNPEKGDAEKVTLESLKLTRKEALEILEEENIKLDDDASDEDIAAEVKELM